jgi:hypothetical protein
VWRTRHASRHNLARAQPCSTLDAGKPRMAGAPPVPMNYLRSMALCSADLTLERGDFIKDHERASSSEASYTCTNHDTLYEWMDKNYDSWPTNQNGTRNV